MPDSAPPNRRGDVHALPAVTNLGCEQNPNGTLVISWDWPEGLERVRVLVQGERMSTNPEEGHTFGVTQRAYTRHVTVERDVLDHLISVGHTTLTIAVESLDSEAYDYGGPARATADTKCALRTTSVQWGRR